MSATAEHRCFCAARIDFAGDAMQHSPVLQRLSAASVVAARSGASSPALAATKQHGVRELLQGGRCSEGPATGGAVERGSCCSPSTTAASHVTTTVRRWPESGAAMEHRPGGRRCCVGAFVALHGADMELQWSIAGAVGAALSLCRVTQCCHEAAMVHRRWPSCGIRWPAWRLLQRRRCCILWPALPSNFCSIVIVAWVRDATDCGRRCTRRVVASPLMRGRRRGCDDGCVGAAVAGFFASSSLLRGGGCRTGAGAGGCMTRGEGRTVGGGVV